MFVHLFFIACEELHNFDHLACQLAAYHVNGALRVYGTMMYQIFVRNGGMVMLAEDTNRNRTGRAARQGNTYAIYGIYRDNGGNEPDIVNVDGWGERFGNGCRLIRFVSMEDEGIPSRMRALQLLENPINIMLLLNGSFATRVWRNGGAPPEILRLLRHVVADRHDDVELAFTHVVLDGVVLVPAPV